MSMQARGQLRAWLPFRSQMFADDFRAMFANQQTKVGEKKTIKMQYEIHDYDGSCQMVEDPIDISVAVYERSKYKWLFMDFKLLHEYWTGGIYKSSPDTCVMIMHEKGPKPFGLPYARRRANVEDVNSKDLEVMRDKGWVFPKEVDMRLMVDGVELEGPPVRLKFEFADGKAWVRDLHRLQAEPYRLADLYDCGYSLRNDNEVLKMASTTPAPPYPDPEELAGPLYQGLSPGPVEDNGAGAAAPAGADASEAASAGEQADAAAATATQAQAGDGQDAEAEIPPTQVLAGADEAAPAAEAAGQEGEEQEGAQAADVGATSEQQVSGRGKRGRPSAAADKEANTKEGKGAAVTGHKRPRTAEEPAAGPGSGEVRKSARTGAGTTAAAAAAAGKEAAGAARGKRARASANAAPSTNAPQTLKGFLDVMSGRRPGGDPDNQPCFICNVRESTDDNMIYLCDNMNCGWGAHQACLGLVAPLPEGADWFCCFGCQSEHLVAQGKEPMPPPEQVPQTTEEGTRAGSVEPAPAKRSKGGKASKAQPAPAAAAAADEDVEMADQQEEEEEEGQGAGRPGAGLSKTPGPTGAAKRGRPAKQAPGSAPPKVAPAGEAQEEQAGAQDAAPAGTKRKQGRPRKHPQSAAAAAGGPAEAAAPEVTATAAEPSKAAGKATGSTRSNNSAAADTAAAAAAAAGAGTAAALKAAGKQQAAKARAGAASEPKAAAADSAAPGQDAGGPAGPAAVMAADAGAAAAAVAQVVLPVAQFEGSFVTRASRMAILESMALLLHSLGAAQAVPVLFKSFLEEEGTPEGRMQVTHYYTWLRYYWRVQDVPGLRQVLRVQYKLPL